ncbi:hypothetical protein [Cytobacillus praedii]|uniref:Uncharacterized protein n=1 Tax=Cytobacillus praedii TaxID=1742358 RepID=A0A4R1AXK5_9BACI|nr:hypothetical protein [Cytobacillus praedii]TCJ05059.1 hypothetical protein E0Y62_07535 [Cytobacillus praedii]
MSKEKVNSIRIMEVDMTSCHHCGETFYEFRDYELSECPHCKEELVNSCSIDGTKEVQIEVDSMTGKIILDKEQQQEIERLNNQIKEIEKVSDYNADLRMSYKKALETIAYKGFNVESNRIVVKMQSIAREALVNKR